MPSGSPLDTPVAPAADPRARGRRRPVFAVVAAIAITTLLAVAWAIPPVAVAVAWPFLFVVPGWLLVARVVPRLGVAGRLGVGIVVSTFVAAHAANLLGLAAGGFDRDVALVVVAGLAISSLVLAVGPLPGLAPPPTLRPAAALEAARAERAPFILATIATIAIGTILAANAWQHVPGGWVAGGWNWSDLLVHVAIGQSLIEGNFPPQVPYFAGVPLTYHWFADFHGAIAAILVGTHVIPVFIVSSAVMAGALALVAWELARAFLGSRRAATIATILVLGAGGMGWLRLVADVAAGAGGVAELIQEFPYDNSWEPGWPYFRIASILGTGLLPHRATTFGLPGLLAVLLLVRVSLGRRPQGMALAGILAALLAPFHFYFFPATYLLVGMYVVAKRAWRRRGWLREAALFLAPAVLALPFVLGPVLLQRERGSIHLIAGWSQAPIEDGLLAVAFFYVTNLGIPLILGIAALIAARPPARLFLALWAIALFLVPNVVMAGAVAFDMNKYFQLVFVALALLGGWFLRRRRTLVVALVVAAAAVSPTLIAVWHVASRPIALTTAEERAARWIGSETPPLSVFVTDAQINSPVDLAGRLRLTTFAPYAANLGYDPRVRASDVESAFCGGSEAAADVMLRYGATYVLDREIPFDCGGRPSTDFAASPRFDAVYDAGVRIWRFRG